jgi:alpha-beta hydrolase superfamily lysophospholipase
MPNGEGERQEGPSLLRKESLHLFPSSDGYAFYARVFAPPSTPLGRVVFLHGIRSHGGWYVRSCCELAAAGYEVHFLDRRGSGYNTARRGDTPNFRRLLTDVVEYLMHLRTRRADLPLVLGGISWGGKLALGVPAEKPGLVDGVMLLSPGLVPKVSPPFATRLRIAVARFLNPTKLFPIPLNEPDLFTADVEWQRFIASDRHGLTEATARFLFESVRFDLHLKRAVKRVRCPVLLALAEHDRILDNPGTRRYLMRLTGAKSVTVIDYPGTHHTLEFEPVPLVPDLLRWLGRIIAA